jgi:hypothetical protein
MKADGDILELRYFSKWMNVKKYGKDKENMRIGNEYYKSSIKHSKIQIKLNRVILILKVHRNR